MVTITVTAKGQIVIPSRIRKRHGIKKGLTLGITEKGDRIILHPLTPHYFDKMAGILSTKGKLTKRLLEERRKDKQKENRR